MHMCAQSANLKWKYHTMATGIWMKLGVYRDFWCPQKIRVEASLEFKKASHSAMGSTQTHKNSTCKECQIGWSVDQWLFLLFEEYFGALTHAHDTSIKAGPPPPLEAILVIFGRSILIFFVWKLLEKMKNDTTFVHIHSGHHLGDAKMSKKGTSLCRI